MVRTEPTADDSLAAIFERSKFGMAIAAMIRIIATTISNSIGEKPFCFVIIDLMRPHKKKGGSEASSLVPMVSLAQELVANRARNARGVRNRCACSRRNADGGSTWGHKLDQPSLVCAEGTHTGRLHCGR